MAVTPVTLEWPAYRLLPYERDLALREVAAVMRPCGQIILNGAVQLQTRSPASASRLTYFKCARSAKGILETTQERLERGTRGDPDGARRQATRYSVHGLHDYKGKFNPQVAKAILNYLHLERGRILDPFCGSGTTLVECAHAGISAVGCDVNPLAVFIANAKLSALSISLPDLLDSAKRVVHVVSKRAVETPPSDPARLEYLRAWFPPENLTIIEMLHVAISGEEPPIKEVLMAIVSDLLREYSWQEPIDLRIRRRKSAPPATPILSEFLRMCEKLGARVAAAQDVLGRLEPSCRAILANSKSLTRHQINTDKPMDGAVTSPPYATALPYIDTQRLSLVWLGLTPPRHLPRLQAQLIGSREFHGDYDRSWDERLILNSDGLPRRMHAFCEELRSSLTEQDGFRRRAVPLLLYRYMVGMRAMFRSVAALLKPGAPFALIVGHNHTVLGGTRIDIDTPAILAELASTASYDVQERIELQTYQRYGLHQKNAIGKEELIILRRQ